MSLRIVFNTCSRAFQQSFVFDVRVNMTRKSCVLRHKRSETKAARFCSSSSNFQPQLDRETPPLEEIQESEQESQSDHVEESQPKSMKFLIVGLGNPDMQRSRHSVGMLFVDQLTKQLGISWTKDVYKKTGGFTAKARLDNVEISFLKPRVPMNLNGTSVNKSVRHFDVTPENTYLIHDELDKAVGKFQLKEGGSANGHKGVKSVMDSLKSDVMPCVKIGIDRPSDPDSVSEYVLDNFSLEELKAIRGVLESSAKTLLDHIGGRCGTELSVHMGRYVDDIGYDSDEELQRHFRKGYQNRNYSSRDRDNWRPGGHRQDYNRRGNDRRDNDRRDNFRDDHADFNDSRRSRSTRDYEDDRGSRRDALYNEE